MYTYMVEFYHLEKCLSEVLDRTKLHKKGPRNIYIWGKFTALVIDTFYVKYCSVLLNLSQNRDNFLD